jgi:hypothetical protein
LGFATRQLVGGQVAPTLAEPMDESVNEASQTDPRFKTTKRYSKLSVDEVVDKLLQDKGYDPVKFPRNETIRKRMLRLGYELTRVRKAKPKKKIPQTDAIFEQLHKVHACRSARPC